MATTTPDQAATPANDDTPRVQLVIDLATHTLRLPAGLPVGVTLRAGIVNGMVELELEPAFWAVEPAKASA